MAAPRPFLISCQYWISVVQFFAALSLSGLSAFWITLHQPLIPGGIGGLLAAMLGFWIITIVNNLFMVTVDFRRTNTYLGCIAAQTALNLALTVANLVTLLYPLYGVPHFVWHLRGPVIYILLGTSMLITGLGSIFLSFICCCLVVMLHSHSTVSAKQLWTINTKDACYGLVPHSAEPHALSVFGTSRKTPIRNSILSFLTLLFLRRVRPSETWVYALARNTFAAVAIVILILRTMGALLRAENAISTRTVSGTCENRATREHDIHVMMERLDYEGVNAASFGPIEIAVNVSRSVTRNNLRPFVNDPCSSVWLKQFNYTIGNEMIEGRTLGLFSCPWYLRTSRTFTDMFNALTYRIEIRSNSSWTSDGLSPLLWLVNPSDKEWPEPRYNWTHQVRAYVPPFQLVRGSHVESQARLITRRLIRSSIMKEIISNSEPEYDRISLYPIVPLSIRPLNASNTIGIIASATIHTSLAPGLMHFQTQVDKKNFSAPLYDVCDFVEDYRSSSVLDVIGSVGGLFALLQALHILLFGRPLLWGLTGAKLITPFGLLGTCSSRGFKRRLKEEYHHTSPDDGTETIRIVNFLRDFVIEFGPADFDPNQRPAERSSPSFSCLPAVDETADSQVPLMPMRTTVEVASKESELMVDRHRADNSV